MNEHHAEIERLTTQAKSLPDGPTKVALFEEAVRLADSAADVEGAFELRMELIRAACFSARSDLGLVAMAWCLAQFDRRPDRYNEWSLLWKYKWIAGSAVSFPAITLTQATQLFADMGRRFRAFGAPHAVLSNGRSNALWMGRLEEALAFDAELADTPRDVLSDCPACVLREELEFLVETQRPEAAVEFFEKKVTEETRCTHEPHRILSIALRPYWRLGRLDKAQELHQRGYKMVARDPAFVRAWGRHLDYAALTGQVAAVRRMIQKHTEAGLASVCQNSKLSYLTGAHLGLKRLAHEGVKTMKLTLAEPLDVASSAKGYDTTALADWFLAEARRIGELFDRRNDNAFYEDRLAQRCADLDLAIARGDRIEGA